jgi:hypothetical protein
MILISLLLLATPAWAEDAAEQPEFQDSVIRVTSVPTGAEIDVDGIACGTTPATIRVSPGTHTVTVSLGGQRMRTSVTVAEDELSEVEIELAAAAPQEQPAAIPSPFEDVHTMMREYRAESQARDEERPSRAPEDREEREEPEDRGPWARRVTRWPLFEVSFDTGVISRDYAVPIDPSIDTSGRSEASLDSGYFGIMGFELEIYPFARVRTEALRGLGIETSFAQGVGLEIVNTRRSEVVDSDYSEGGVDLVYRLSLGRDDAGATLITRFGWHRAWFWLGDIGNDIVPPFYYDSVRLDGGVQVPLGTRHLLFDFGLAYLGVPGIGYQAEEAYGASGTLPDVNGGEVRAGLTARVGGLFLSWLWIGRFFKSEFEGTGMGFGYEPSTRIDQGWSGIRTVGPVEDHYHQFRLSVGYRW